MEGKPTGLNATDYYKDLRKLRHLFPGNFSCWRCQPMPNHCEGYKMKGGNAGYSFEKETWLRGKLAGVETTLDVFQLGRLVNVCIW